MFRVVSHKLPSTRPLHQSLQRRTMQIKAIPMRWKSGDNYAYLLTDSTTKHTWLIDPAYPKDIPESSFDNLEVTAIVNTHHHQDHAGGNPFYKKKLGVQVIAGRDSQLVEYSPQHHEVLKLGNDISITAIHTPCHTQDSICYFVEDGVTKERAVFTGDTLFTAGCGRFFEGEPVEMLESLGKLAQLPLDTVVYPGHEYTAGNVAFAKTVMKSDALDKLDKFVQENEITTGKFTIKDELEFNPFMRCDDEKIKAKLHVADDVELMGLLRQMKNNF